VPRLADTSEYYWAHATHTRHTDQPRRFDPFEGKLAMVRVRLPEREPRRFSTRIGTVEPGDHLLATTYQANDKFAVHLGYELRRLDLITPPRQLLRFGAISVLTPLVSHTAINGAAFTAEADARGIRAVPVVVVNGEQLGQGPMSIERALELLERLTG